MPYHISRSRGGKPLQYSTKYIDGQLKHERLKWEDEKQGIHKDRANNLEMILQRLDER